MEQDIQTHLNPPETKLFNGITKIQAYAILKKANGATNKEISDELEISINTIKGWFSTRGTATYRAYKQYRDEMITQIGLDSLHQIRLQTEKAVNTIIDLMDEKQPPAVRLRASMYILEKDLPLTLTEKEERKEFFGKMAFMMEKMGVNMDDLTDTGEKGEKAREVFNYSMDVLDEIDSWS